MQKVSRPRAAGQAARATDVRFFGAIPAAIAVRNTVPIVVSIVVSIAVSIAVPIAVPIAPIVVSIVALHLTSDAAVARTIDGPLLFDQALRPGERPDHMPAREPGASGRADTLSFGYYQEIGGELYAVPGETWTFDHGAPDPFEGWYAVDLTQNDFVAGRHITQEIWTADPGNPPTAPVIAGLGSAWIGLFEGEADALCWDAGLGYGNGWCQRVASPPLTYIGSGTVVLQFTYFNHTEPGFDYTRILLEVEGEVVPLNGNGFHNRIGTPPAGPWATYAREISEAELGGSGDPREFRVVFQMESDGGWSDQSGEYDTEYGAFGADDLSLTGSLVGGDAVYTFDESLEGWAPSACPAIGSFFGVNDVANYLILDPCRCAIEGNVLGWHDENLKHPVGQHVQSFSPPADRTNVQYLNGILADWDMYAEMPQANGVFYRAGWNYYPFVCPATGESMWSGRIGINTFYYAGDEPACFGTRSVGTDWGLPPDCDLVGFIYELYASCDAFTIPSTVCTGVTNFTPVIDNIRIRMTSVPEAPVVSIDTGGTFQDGLGQNDYTLRPTDPGNANITRDKNGEDPNRPDILGDSLSITGPVPSASTRWLAKLWFRLPRTGPGQLSTPGYTTWRDLVADGLEIIGPSASFTFGWMDSMEIGTHVYRNKFVSQFHEMDDDFVAPEQGEDNEIIRDGILAPGTQVEYFITSFYTCTPDIQFYLPDTTGGNSLEFEILPGYRMVGSSYRFPSVLYVDAHNRGSQEPIEDALNQILHGAGPGAPRPLHADWDRYDYLDASSNWKASLFRDSHSNNGGHFHQLLGYRTIIVDTGTLDGDWLMTEEDWDGFGDWLEYTYWTSNDFRQAWYGTGNSIAKAIASQGGDFLTSMLGAGFECGAYHDPGCPFGESENDENYCVRLEPVGGAGWVPDQPLDLWGNGCPSLFELDVLVPDGGTTSKMYRKVGSSQSAGAAQVVFDRDDHEWNYRSVLDGYSLVHATARDLGNPGPAEECPNSPGDATEAIRSELQHTLEWALCWDFEAYGPIPLVRESYFYYWPPEHPCPTSDVSESEQWLPANALFANRPNPIGASTTIRFSTALAGPVDLAIYDAAGRRIRVLATTAPAAGTHEAVWDGTDDHGRRVASGIYWTQLQIGDWKSNRKMVVLR